MVLAAPLHCTFQAVSLPLCSVLFPINNFASWCGFSFAVSSSHDSKLVERCLSFNSRPHYRCWHDRAERGWCRYGRQRGNWRGILNTSAVDSSLGSHCHILLWPPVLLQLVVSIVLALLPPLDMAQEVSACVQPVRDPDHEPSLSRYPAVDSLSVECSMGCTQRGRRQEPNMHGTGLVR